MTAIVDPSTNDARAKRNVIVLVMAQAILGAQMPMLFVVGGLAGLTIAPSPLLATLPISLIVFGSMTTAPWISFTSFSHPKQGGGHSIPRTVFGKIFERDGKFWLPFHLEVDHALMDGIHMAKYFEFHLSVTSHPYVFSSSS